MAKPVITVISMSLFTMLLLIGLFIWLAHPSGTVNVRWQTPNKFDDSSDLHSREIEEYRIYWSNQSQTVNGHVSVPGNVYSYRISGLTLEEYEISVVAKSIYGTASERAKITLMVKPEKE